MVSVIIMAGGLGKRMNSDLPKVLHKVGDIPMLVHLIKTSLKLKANNIFIIVGKFKEIIQTTVNQYFENKEILKINYVIQSEALGTGHAIQCTHENIKELNENIIILSGDTPLISQESLENIVKMSDESECVIMVRETDNPKGLGRIITNQNLFVKIVEEKDATNEEKLINLVNCGIYMINSKLITNNIFKINNDNNQKEYYLTDLIGLLKNQTNIKFYNLPKDREFELMGVNNPEELVLLNKMYHDNNK